ncbi:MAG: 2,5-diamino-6-(ribosylamino)-4(3H)-pyrimidinone 5'-phosphate reductase [Methanosphaera sp.]|nr:2,5-diamino-6-(ribosylamino)-4(3H)-pyrimidinone 5'-phosphate reductase [Methanosphaera sp.]
MKPYILLNSAMTADGKIATKNSSTQISGPEDLIRVHKLRKKFDGIMVGINTVLIDNPKLSIHKIDCPKKFNPTRIIIDSKARTPLNSLVLNDDAETIIIVSKKASQTNIDNLAKLCEVIICGEDQVDLTKAMKKLYDYGIKSILLEGGSTLNFSMFEEKLIDELSICVGSKILGGKDSKTLVDGNGFNENETIRLKLKDIEKLDEDVILHYYVIY